MLVDEILLLEFFNIFYRIPHTIDFEKLGIFEDC
jgi:hypothetical protein